MEGTRKLVEGKIKPITIVPDLKFYLGDSVSVEEVSDLAD